MGDLCVALECQPLRSVCDGLCLHGQTRDSDSASTTLFVSNHFAVIGSEPLSKLIPGG